MNTGAVKYESKQEKGQTGAQKARKPLLLKLPSKAVLDADDRELLKVTLEARDEWIETSTNFDYVSQDLLIDYYTYRMKACEARYTYFLKLVKEKGLARYL